MGSSAGGVVCCRRELRCCWDVGGDECRPGRKFVGVVEKRVKVRWACFGKD